MKLDFFVKILDFKLKILIKIKLSKKELKNEEQFYLTKKNSGLKLFYRASLDSG